MLDEHIGQMGMFMVVAGLAGSIVGGIILDKFKKFKLTSLITYILTLVLMIAFTFAIDQQNIYIDYILIVALGLFSLIKTICIVPKYSALHVDYFFQLSVSILRKPKGFFMTGYLPIGFEFGAEITFPESEASSSGLLNCSAQMFGIIITAGSQELINFLMNQNQSKIQGGLYANVTMIVCLCVGFILTAFIKENLKRQSAENEDVFKNTLNNKRFQQILLCIQPII